MNIIMVLYNGHNTLPSYSSNAGYSPKWVDKLVSAIERNTSIPLSFYCLVDRDDYVFQKKNVVPILLKETINGWSPMMEAFRPDICSRHRMVFGLDTIITGNIDHIIEWNGACGLLDDPYHPYTLCNGIGIYNESTASRFWYMWNERSRLFPDNQLYYHGFLSEMAFLRLVAKDSARSLNRIFPKEIQSYKAHWRASSENERKNARIVYFHGDPKPPHVEQELLEHWI